MLENYWLVPAKDPWNNRHIQINSDDLLQGFYNAIGCEYIEVAYMIDTPLKPPEGVIMIVDEEGWLHEDAVQNVLGSALCGQPIAGNIVFARKGFRNGEPDIVGLENEDLSFFSYMFDKGITIGQTEMP